MDTSIKVLIVDDFATMRRILKNILKQLGFKNLVEADDGTTAWEILEDQQIDLIISDWNMPKMTGLELLKKVRADAKYKTAPFLMVTAEAQKQNVIEAVQAGVSNYVVKPFTAEAISDKLKKDFKMSPESSVTEAIDSPVNEENAFDRSGIAGVSQGLVQVLGTARKVSKSDSSVLITGESGTGKELIARAIHKNSPRREGPMVVINCGAIPGELLESELFGHEKGAFTGAHRARTGRFEIADQGTIFLDEIGDMSPELQVKLLRALQERRFERVGGSQTIEVDIRVISATNKDLPAAIEKGDFREDLYYRLNVIPIHILPLRDRPEDIMHLVDHFQNRLTARDAGFRPKVFSDKALKAMAAYEWPGNIRELENLVERISVLVESDAVDIQDLPECMTGIAPNPSSPSVASVFSSDLGFVEAVDLYQRALITHALNEVGWVKAKAAEMLKMNRTTLVEKIKKMNIEPESEMPFF